MEKSSCKSLLRRLLAFTLALILVVSVLPINLLTVWAEEELRVNVERTGNGSVSYSVDGTTIQLFEDGQDQDYFDVDVEVEGDKVASITCTAASNGLVSEVKVGKTIKSQNSGQQSVTVDLTKADFEETNLDAGALYVYVTFAEVQQSTYTVKPGTLSNVSLSVKGKDDENFSELSGDGLPFAEAKLPVTVQVSPFEGYELESVQVNEGDPITLDGDNCFTLTEDGFNESGVATINASAVKETAEENYKLDPVTLTNCTATIKRGGNTTALASNAEITAAELEAGVTLSFTAKEEEGKTYTVSSVKINNEEKTGTDDLGKTEFVYHLTEADFGDEKTIAVEAVFEEAEEPAEPTKLNIGRPNGYSVRIRNSDGSYPNNPQTGEVEVTLPVHIKITVPKADKKVITAVKLEKTGDETEDILIPIEAPAAECEVEITEADYRGAATRTLVVELAPVFDLKLSRSSSQHAQVFAAVKEDGSYPETGTEITAAAPVTVLSGSDVKLTVTVAEGYVVTGVKVNDAEPAGLSVDETGASFELTNVSEAQEIKVEAEAVYTIELKDSDLSYGTVKLLDQNGEELGSLTADAPLSLRLEQLTGAKIVFAAQTGAAICSLAVDETEKEDACREANYDYTLPTEEDELLALFGEDNTLSVKVIFKQMFTLTITAGEHGTVAATCGDESFAQGQTYSVFAGDVLSFTATPENTNYIVQSVELSYSDGTAAEQPSFDTSDTDEASFTVAVAKNVTVKVTFAKRASFSDISFYWGTVAASYLEPLYSTNACQVYVFKPYSDSSVKLNMKINSGDQTYPVFFNNKDGFSYNDNNDYRYTDISVAIQLLTYAQSYYWGHYHSWVKIQVPGSIDDYSQHMAIVIDKDKPTVELNGNYDGKYFSAAPEIAISINEPTDEAVQTAISGKKLPAEAASHAFSGLSVLYYYFGDFDASKEPGSEGTYEINAYDAGSSIQSAALSFEIAAEALEEGLNTVTIVAVDRAGNKGYKTFSIGYNSRLGLSFDDVEFYEDEEDGTVYYLADRTATILVRDTAEDFNPNGISFTGDSTAFEYIDSDWIPAEDEENSYTRRIRFTDGSYQLNELRYVSNALDESGNAIPTSIPVNESFVVDQTPPSVTLKIDGDDEHAWNSLLTSLNFGVWKTGAVTVKATIQENGSGIKDKNKEYYIHEYTNENDASFLTETQLKELYASNPGAWHKYSDGGISVSANKRVVIYFRVKDKAGHVVFVSTNGIITDSTDPNAAIELPSTSHTHNGHKLYGIEGGPNVDVTIKATEPSVRSGLKTVAYLVTTTELTDAEAAAQSGWTEINLAPDAAPAYEDLVREYTEVVPVEKSLNSCTVCVYVRAVDNAGRSKMTHEVFDVDYVAPTIQIAGDSTDDHVVRLTYTERSSHFNKNKAVENLTVMGSDGNGHTSQLQVNRDYTITWEATENENNLDTDTHVLKVTFVEDYIYNISASFTDLAGNPVSTNAYGFTLDTTPPSGSITVEGKGTWNKILETLTFGLWSNSQNLAVTGTAEDNISGLQSVSFYKSSATAALDETALKELPDEEWEEISGEWGTALVNFNVTELEPNERAVIYLRLIDKKGNAKYIGTDGVVIETAMEKEWIALAPSAASGVDKIGLPVYNAGDDVYVDVTVKDFENEDEPNSGIKLVTYEITAPGCAPKTGTLYSYEYTRDTGENPNGGHLVVYENGEKIKDERGVLPTYEDLPHNWSGRIPVDKEKFNNCKVTVKVMVTDNAGNEAENAVDLDVDNTAPTIEITRDDTVCDQKEGADENFYVAAAIRITYTERGDHFSEADALAGLTVKGRNATEELTLTEGEDYVITWDDSSTEQNRDTDTHVMTILFNKDANYEITAVYTDLAGNEAAEAASDSFTLDTEAPEGSVTVVGKGTWTKLVETLTFGLWSKEQVDVTGSAKDEISSLKSVKYYKTAETAALDEDALEDVAWHELADGWGAEVEGFEVATVSPNEKFVIYLRLMDQAGNVKYICTDGVVVDNEMIGGENGWISLQPSAASGKDADGKPVYGISDEVYVDVDIKDYANEDDPNSGIGVVNYEITAPGCETESGTLYLYDFTRYEGDDVNGGTLIISENGEITQEEEGVLPAYEDLPHEWSGRIPVDKEKFNSCGVKVTVSVGDNAGNTASHSVDLDIDNTAPTIEVAYETTQNARAADGYYTSITATVTITERDHHFDPAAATAGIVVKGSDVDVKDLNLKAGTDFIISDWVKKDGDTPDACTHVATIQFKTDANYSLEISYTDRATNEAVPSYSATFTKDATQPSGTLAIKKLTDKTWIDKIVDTLTFALFSRESVDVTHTASDKISPLISVAYFKTEKDTLYSEGQLDKLDESSWKTVAESKFAAGSLSVGPDTRAVVYLRVIDKAGNIRYVSTDGFILDATNPPVDQMAPRVTVTQPVNEIYNTDVPIRAQVVDPIVNGSYSGLKEVRYEVKNMGTVTQSGVLYTYTGTATSQSGLTQKWEGDGKIVVDSAKNNSNDVEIIVYAEDNSGNKGQDSVKIKIDVTDPTISVSYDNNDGDTSFANDKSDAFFKAGRTATITITERNFDRNAVVITVTKNGVAQQVNPNWVENTAGGNGDGTTHVARLSFDDDGDYSFAISCTDLAGNKNKDVTFNGLAPERFTIDKTKPTVTVSYDNNDVRSEKYFNAGRIATVTIREHNFETSRIDVRITAANAGKTISQPKITAWEQKGDDQYSARIQFTEDGDYSFDISYKDKAGNENEAVVFAEGTKAGSEFTVDTTPPEVTLTGVENESANGDKGSIGFTLTATDTNFDVFEPVLTAYVYKDGKLTEQQIDLAGYIKDVANGKELVIDNLPEDGVYILTCTVVDLAGNAFESYDHNGTKVAADGTEKVQMTIFSVNRNGSTFYADDYSIALFDQYYAQSVDRDVVIYEINPDRLTEHAVTLNGAELKENSDYTVEEETTKNWNKYSYTIHKNLFEEEGTYKLNVSSVDKAGNTADSDDMGGVRALNGDDGKVFEVKFSVDRTAPIVTVSGLEENGRYQTEAQSVTMIPVDDGGMLDSLTITVMDEEGNVFSDLGMRLEGKELEDMLSENGSKITLTLPENADQYYVYLSCSDTAGNETKMEFKEVTVSTSAFRIFWANKPLRWGSIGGVAGVGALFFFLLLAKKRKKKEEEVVPEKKA